ncbi:MAG: hypothetical protein J6127_03830 [Clostridiales bacterium]|nr:hypothetical protein [Clostridiales bacterium]
MACFLVPAAEAVVTTIITKALESKEQKVEVSLGDKNIEKLETSHFSRKLKWLNNLLWGGSALLAFEHVWHGEVVPWFPFLTAAGNPEDMAEVIHEMSTVGVTMAILVTAVWVGMVVISKTIEKRADVPSVAEVKEG